MSMLNWWLAGVMSGNLWYVGGLVLAILLLLMAKEAIYTRKR